MFDGQDKDTGVIVKQTIRVAGIATLTSVSLGVLVAGWAVLEGEPRQAVIESLTTVAGLGGLLLLAAVVSLPVSLPTGLAGGAVAAFVLARESGGRPLISWIGRGSAWGLTLGAAGLMMYLAVMNLRSKDELLPILVLSAPLGAVPGAVIGCIVGAYCWAQIRHRAGG